MTHSECVPHLLGWVPALPATWICNKQQLDGCYSFKLIYHQQTSGAPAGFDAPFGLLPAAGAVENRPVSGAVGAGSLEYSQRSC